MAAKLAPHGASLLLVLGQQGEQQLAGRLPAQLAIGGEDARDTLVVQGEDGHA
jgi:hypothetical protein